MEASGIRPLEVKFDVSFWCLHAEFSARMYRPRRVRGQTDDTSVVNPVVTDAVMLWRAMFAPASVSPIDRSDQARVEALNSLAVRGVAGVSQDPRPPPEETMLLGCFRLVLDDVSTRRSLSISTWL